MKKRNTHAKQTVRDLLAAAGMALSQDMLEERAAGKMDRVTIYRILNSFCEDGTVHRIISEEGKAYYALCHGCPPGRHTHSHAHFRCIACHRVECLPASVKVALPEGYIEERANYIISGCCPRCGTSQ